MPFFPFSGFDAWESPCRVQIASVLPAAREEAAEGGPGTVAASVLRRMLDKGGFSSGQREDLEFVLGTLEELALQLRGSGKLAEETAQRRISVGSNQMCLEETTERFLLSFTEQPRTHPSFRNVAQGVRFALRAARRARAVAADRVEAASPDRVVNFDFAAQCVVDKLSSWSDFDVFRMAQVTENQPLQHVAVAVLNRLGLINYFKFPAPELQKFVAELEGMYLDNPYHNGLHAADVTQAVHCLLIGSHFSEIELFSSIFAAMCHDAGHPGVTNDFRIQSADDCAITYNDKSVNENMHCALTYRLLRRSDCNFLGAMTVDQRRLIRRLTISLVLSTDMAVHFTELEKFQASVQASGTDTAKWDNSDKALGLALHAADISNVCRPLRLARRWTDLLLSEFFAQGDQERRLGRPLSPLCDRETVSLPDSQIGFIDFIVKPVFEAVQGCFNAWVPLQNLGTTYSMWVEENEKAKLMRRSGRLRPSGNSLTTSMQILVPLVQH